MALKLTKPAPFKEAINRLASKQVVASPMDSSAWQQEPLAIRERSYFSAKVESAQFLQRGKDLLDDYIEGNITETPNGPMIAVGSRAAFVDQLQQFARAEGLESGGPEGTLRDVRSLTRLNLVYDVQVQQAADFGNWKQGNDTDILWAYPAQRFIREINVKEPRPLHEENTGEVRRKDDMEFWTKMNDPEIGGFGVPWGPWGFNSGMGVEDVDRIEAIKLGLVDPDEAVEMPDKAFNDHMEASADGLDPEIAGQLKKDLGEDADISGGRVTARAGALFAIGFPMMVVQAFNADQPRVPAGEHGGGQFAPRDGGGSGSASRITEKDLPKDPQFISSNAANVAKNQKDLADLKAWALAGELDKVKAFTTQSPKLASWHEKLLGVIGSKDKTPESSQHPPAVKPEPASAPTAPTKPVQPPTAKGDTASALAAAGLSPEMLAPIAKESAKPGAPAAALRVKAMDALWSANAHQENAFLSLKAQPEDKEVLIKGIGSGNLDKLRTEFKDTPVYDLAVLSSMRADPGYSEGRGVCQMQSRSIKVWSNGLPGDYRHELGHAIRSSLSGGGNFGTPSAISTAVMADYKSAIERRSKNKMPSGMDGKDPKTKDWMEENWGVPGKRALDNWEEYFAEHYRVYHRENYRDANEGGNGERLARYRKLHPTMARVFDTYYTVAKLAQGV